MKWKEWKGVNKKGSAVNLKKTTQVQNRHYICILHDSKNK